MGSCFRRYYANCSAIISHLISWREWEFLDLRDGGAESCFVRLRVLRRLRYMHRPGERFYYFLIQPRLRPSYFITWHRKRRQRRFKENAQSILYHFWPTATTFSLFQTSLLRSRSRSPIISSSCLILTCSSLFMAHASMSDSAAVASANQQKHRRF